ncbi:hypothetical protein Moror_9559 [Moniliophthora roreri MCA 2997]|uniref:Serpentine receptor class gamma n=1 Tax=Moniliophthora roreri (strain MCA 2997) TaxID=1381753 RepID=V2XEA2_MONRO|nr:hypothetical protein Moror_9559 [Moniliophthora roreri MCA 2997]
MALSKDSGFLSPTYIVKGPFTVIALEFFLYGFYLLLFILSIHIFNKRKPPFPQAKFYFNSIVILFVLATTELIFDAVYKVQRSLSQLFLASSTGEVSREEMFVLTPLELGSLIITFFTRCFGNAVADAILIHRFYVT